MNICVCVCVCALWVWSTAGLLFGGRTQPQGCNSFQMMKKSEIWIAENERGGVLKASWLAEVGQLWVVGRPILTTTVWLIHILSELCCAVWGVSLAWGTCSDMGAGDWFAANGGKGQAALCSLLLFSQSHSCILFSTAIACFIITVGGGNGGEPHLANGCLFPF